MRRKSQPDAIVSSQVLGRAGCGPCGEVLGRAHHRHAQVRAEADSDHVLGDLVSHSNAGVKALGDDVRHRVVDADLDVDVGIVAHDLGQLGPENAGCCMFGGRDADGSHRLVA
ncbi:hypothetical protein G6F59_016178 [Rhizopus arrhizus]|nr:hypothetical protein G6F59_016178 [Rhizopus arrhizus]